MLTRLRISRECEKNTHTITRRSITATVQTQPRLLHAKSRVFVLKTISSPGREAIEQHYRHYRRLSLEIGFTSIPWLITICRQQQSEEDRERVRVKVREGGENDRKWGKRVKVEGDEGLGEREQGEYTLYYLWISAKGYTVIFQVEYYLLICR